MNKDNTTPAPSAPSADGRTMQSTITKEQCEAALNRLSTKDASTLSYGYSLANGRTWFTIQTGLFSAWEALKKQGLLTDYPIPATQEGRRNYQFTELGHVVAIALDILDPPTPAPSEEA